MIANIAKNNFANRISACFFINFCIYNIEKHRKMETDELSVSRTLSGDKNAFSKLVQKYGSAVYGLAYHLVGDFADAQGLTQKAFVTTYKRLPQLKDHSRFPG